MRGAAHPAADAVRDAKRAARAGNVERVLAALGHLLRVRDHEAARIKHELIRLAYRRAADMGAGMRYVAEVRGHLRPQVRQRTSLV